MLGLPSRADLINAVELCISGISLDCFSKFMEVMHCDPIMIGVTFALVFHSFCTSILRSKYFKILSSLSLTYQSRGIATSITVVVRLLLTITAICGLRAVFCFGLRVMFPRCTTCLNPIMLTYIPAKNCGYIAVSFKVVVSSQFWAHIQYMGNGLILSLTQAAVGVLIYSMYLCLVILNDQSLAVINAAVSIFRSNSLSHLKAFSLLV